MAYTSDRQRRWAHTATGTKALGGPAKVAEWDKASKGKNLPATAKPVAGGAKPRRGRPGFHPNKPRGGKFPGTPLAMAHGKK